MDAVDHNPLNPELVLAHSMMRRAFYDGLVVGALGSLCGVTIALVVFWALDHF